MLKDCKKKVTFVFTSCVKKYTLFPRYIREEGYEVYSLFKYDNYFTVGINQFARKKLGHKLRRNYNPMLKDLNNTIIVFDAMIDLYDLKWLKKNNPDAKCVFIVWNPIEFVKIDLDKVKKIGYEIWSYDKGQCDKNHLKYNPFFFCKSMYPLEEIKNIKIKYDVSYVGKDKGRLNKINNLIIDNNWNKLKWYLYVVPDHFWQRFLNDKYKKNIDYKFAQRIQASSKAILELVPSESVSSTIRIMDAMVLKRKLITDGKDIVNFDFYNKNNIFVLGKDNPDELADFLDLPYVNLDEEVFEKYEIHKWVERIIND